MAAAKKYSVEQIIAKLREVERLQGQGISIPAAAKKLGITDQTFYRWRLRYGALKEDEAHRLKLLEQENGRLKKIAKQSGFARSTCSRHHNEPAKRNAYVKPLQVAKSRSFQFQPAAICIFL